MLYPTISAIREYAAVPISRAKHEFWEGVRVPAQPSQSRRLLPSGASFLYENSKIPRFVRETRLNMATDVLTTCAFLELAERRGIVSSTEDCWQRIVDAAPTANPTSRYDVDPKTEVGLRHMTITSPARRSYAKP